MHAQQGEDHPAAGSVFFAFLNTNSDQNMMQASAACELTLQVFNCKKQETINPSFRKVVECVGLRRSIGNMIFLIPIEFTFFRKQNGIPSLFPMRQYFR